MRIKNSIISRHIHKLFPNYKGNDSNFVAENHGETSLHKPSKSTLPKMHYISIIKCGV